MVRTLSVAAGSPRYAVALACAAAVLFGSLIDPSDGGPATVLGLETTIYFHSLGYAALATSTATRD